jgi:hypothetical protein
MMDVPAIMKEVLRVHGIRLSPEDPIWVQATILEFVLADAQADLRKTVLTAQGQIIATGSQQIEASKAVAEQLVAWAGQWSAETLRGAVKAEGDAVIQRIETQTRLARNAAAAARRAALAAFGLLVLAAVLTIWNAVRLPL